MLVKEGFSNTTRGCNRKQSWSTAEELLGIVHIKLKEEFKFEVERLNFFVSPKFHFDHKEYQPYNIFEYMLKSEKVIELGEASQSYLSKRHHLIEFLEEVCSFQKLKITTFVLGIRIMDEVATKYDFLSQELGLISLVCLYLASKLNEHPFFFNFQSLFSYLKNEFTKEKIMKAEKVIFELLEFSIHRVSSIDFLFYFLTKGFVNKKDIPMSTFLHSKVEEIEIVAMRLLVKLLKEVSSVKEKPSFLAAKTFYIIRLYLNFDPWPESLGERFGYRKHQLEFFTDLIDTGDLFEDIAHFKKFDQLDFPCENFPTNFVFHAQSRNFAVDKTIGKKRFSEDFLKNDLSKFNCLRKSSN